MPLYQEGPRNARIVLVGEAPGNQEVASGRPFVGGSGQLLDKLLGGVGVSRRDVFVTNLCHHQPPGNEFKWFERPTNQHHLIRGLVQLRRDIEEIKPNVVVALGTQPLKALTGRVGIDKWRGSILPSTLVPGVKVIGTYHPAAILRVYDYGAVAGFDLAKVLRQSASPEIHLPSRRIILPDGEWVRSGVGKLDFDWVSTAWKLEEAVAHLESAGSYAVDIECRQTASGWKLVCVGFSCHPSWALVIPCDTPQNTLIARRLVENDCRKVYQNGMFDVGFLREMGWNPQNFWWDTMIAHHICYAEAAGGTDEVAAMTKTKRQAAIAKGLAFLASIHTDEPRYKDDGKLWAESGDVRILYRYNGLDCCTTIESQISQVADLASLNLTSQFHERMQLVEPVMEAQAEGLLVNTKRREEMLAALLKREAALQLILDTTAGHPVNVSSNPQVTKLLYDELKLPPKRRKGAVSRTANADALEELAGKYPNVPALRAILHIREQRVLRERYLECPIDEDSRLRSSVDITGTRSYRLSSRASIRGTGTNLQNQPEFVRECVEADPGTVFLAPDYSQAEAVVVGYLAEDEWLQAIFSDPTRDLHRETAAVIFGKKPEEITDVERYLGKKARHALNYGMNAPRFVEVIASESETTGLRINIQQAQRVIDGFFMLHPNHQTVYWGGVRRELAYNRTLTNAWGYKRTFYGRWDDNLLRDAYSWIPQSTVGVLGCEAWVAVADAVRPLGGKVLVNVHDSLLIRVPIERLEDAIPLVNSAMAIPITMKGKTFTIRTDMKVGYNWGNREVDKATGVIKNPNGLRKPKDFFADPTRL